MTRHTLHRVPTVVRHYARREDLALNHNTHRVTVTEGAFLFVFSVFVFMLVTVAVVS